MLSRLPNRVLIYTAILLFGVSLTVVSRAQQSQQKAPAPQPAEQPRKNLQVLKGVPDSQLYRLMNFMAVSLGQQCDFCHVDTGRDPQTGQRKWIWESDDKPEKLTGRRMLQMVLLINGSNKVDFSQNSVTCYTCHRGQRSTVGLPSMPIAKSGHEGMNDPVAP